MRDTLINAPGMGPIWMRGSVINDRFRHISANSKTMTKPPPRKVAAIKEVVAADFNVTVDEIDGRVRTASIALARQVAMQLVREVLACSSTEIAAAFFRNHHGTVLHAFTAVKERIATDAFFASRMDKLRSLVATKLKEVAE